MNKKDIKQKIASLKERRQRVIGTYDWRGKDNYYELLYIQNIDKEIRQFQQMLSKL